MKKKYKLDNINSLNFVIKSPCLIFLKWDLWSWKTHLVNYIINNIIWFNMKIKSPTYTYYNKYDNIYHFDLYRLWNYNEFFLIWWEDIFDNNYWYIFVEWPEIIEKYYKPDIEIILNKTKIKNEREIIIKYNKK